jgi:hypothetical protein
MYVGTEYVCVGVSVSIILRPFPTPLSPLWIYYLSNKAHCFLAANDVPSLALTDQAYVPADVEPIVSITKIVQSCSLLFQFFT